jgi:hypothetical protein
MGASCRRRLGEASAREGAAEEGRERAGNDQVSSVWRGRVWMMATVTRRPQASEDVYGVEEMGAMLDAGVGLQGRTRVMAHARALARPELCRGAVTACLARFLARLGTLVLDNCVCFFA